MSREPTAFWKQARWSSGYGLFGYLPGREWPRYLDTKESGAGELLRPAPLSFRYFFTPLSRADGKITRDGVVVEVVEASRAGRADAEDVVCALNLSAG